MATAAPFAWESLGGQADDVSAVSWGAGRLDLFYNDDDNDAVGHKWFDGAWTPSMTDWESLGGQAGSNIAAVSWAAERLDLFNSAFFIVYHKSFDWAWEPAIDGWALIRGEFMANDASAVSWGAGRLDVFSRRGPSNPLLVYHKYFDAGSWQPAEDDWEELGDNPLLRPDISVTAVSWGPGRLDLFVPFVDNSIYHLYYEGASWKPLPSPPTVYGLHVITATDAGANSTSVELSWTYEPTDPTSLSGASFTLDIEGKLSGYPDDLRQVELGVVGSYTVDLKNEYAYTISLTEATAFGTSAPVSIVFPLPDMSYLVPILL